MASFDVVGGQDIFLLNTFSVGFLSVCVCLCKISLIMVLLKSVGFLMWT